MATFAFFLPSSYCISVIVRCERGITPSTKHILTLPSLMKDINNICFKFGWENKQDILKMTILSTGNVLLNSQLPPFRTMGNDFFKCNLSKEDFLTLSDTTLPSRFWIKCISYWCQYNYDEYVKVASKCSVPPLDHLAKYLGMVTLLCYTFIWHTFKQSIHDRSYMSVELLSLTGQGYL